MTALFGLLGLDDSQRVFVSTLGQQTVMDAIQALVTRYNRELSAAMGVFVERSTQDYKFRYYLPGGGRLQKMSGSAPSAEVKATGQWDVALPLEQFGAALGGTRVSMAYMTAQDLDRHLQTVFIQDMNTIRFEMLRRLFNDTQRTFSDPLWGNLLVQPFANGDAVVYPPVLGVEVEATDDHFYHTAYVQSAISDTNNPFVTIREELVEHFGRTPGGENIVCFINPAARAVVEALADFDEVNDRFVRVGQNTDVPYGLPANLPGTIIGRVSGVWCVVWDFVPSNYILGVHLDAPKPLLARRDPGDTGLPEGLNLVVREETKYPLQASYWEHRTGFGVGNRLNGVFLQFHATAFSIPTGYTF